MAINPMLPMAFLLSERENRRRDVADALLPALLPVPAASRVALTAVVADSAVRRQETNADQVAKQAVEAATSPDLTPETLNRFDRLAPVLARQPELRDRLLAQAKVGDTVVKLLHDKGVDPESEDVQPLRAWLTTDQWNQMTNGVQAAAADAHTNGASASKKATSARTRRVAKKGRRPAAKKVP
jgi:hypothetical protein